MPSATPTSVIREITTRDPVKGASKPSLICGQNSIAGSLVANVHPGDAVTFDWRSASLVLVFFDRLYVLLMLRVHRDSRAIFKLLAFEVPTATPILISTLPMFTTLVLSNLSLVLPSPALSLRNSNFVSYILVLAFRLFILVLFWSDQCAPPPPMTSFIGYFLNGWLKN